jgi:7,8-dihydropterin-6-yl-methyl-4-(beta-D-ribofuranosyl)aminobenzene 5'-phosphate synthase
MLEIDMGRIEKWGCRIPLMAVIFFLPSSTYPEHGPSALTSPPSLPESYPHDHATAVGAELRLTIVYDNNDYDRRLETKWGFSCLIEGPEKTILFDTGGDSATLLRNMKKLDIDPAKIRVIVLSHIHGDHVGGLSGYLAEYRDVVVYLPLSFPESFKEEVRSTGVSVDEVSGPKRLLVDVYTTGEIGNGIKEQSLVIRTGEGLVIITGCAHPGVVKIIRAARQLAAEDTINLVIGGFHLGGAPTSRIESVVKEFRRLSVQRVAPCHCSGEETRRLFRLEYGDDYVHSGVGKRITAP